MATFSERMTQRMAELDIKQADLVRMTGISKSSICQYLTGKFKAKQQNVYKLALALDVNEAWLMGADIDKSRRDLPSSRSASPSIPASLAFKLARLDAGDQAKVEAYTDGLLDQDKYKTVSFTG